MSSIHPSYSVKKRETESADAFQEIEPALISHYAWPENDYRPYAEGKLYRTDDALHVQLLAREPNPKAEFRNFNDQVCKDSCLEFFFSPSPDGQAGYFNFEFNALGTMLAMYGPDRDHRNWIGEDAVRDFGVQAFRNGDNAANTASLWGIRFRIPFRWIEEQSGFTLGPGDVFFGNFYKCGDDTDFPHYGSWSPIVNPQPDFHLPEFFGRLTLD